MAYINGKELFSFPALYTSYKEEYEQVSAELEKSEDALLKKSADVKSLIQRDITSIVIPEGVTEIGENAFRTCRKLTSVTIPNSVNKIGIGAFREANNIPNITIPDSVTVIDREAFYGCGLTSITIPDSVTTLNGSAFMYCSNLLSVKIGKGITILDNYMFAECPSLKKIFIPSNVKEIALKTFSNSSNCMLFDFSEHEEVPILKNTSAFENINPNAKIKVPQRLYKEWVTATNWSVYADYIEYDREYYISPVDNEEYNVTEGKTVEVAMTWSWSDTIGDGSLVVERSYEEDYEDGSSSIITDTIPFHEAIYDDEYDTYDSRGQGKGPWFRLEEGYWYSETYEDYGFTIYSNYQYQGQGDKYTFYRAGTNTTYRIYKKHTYDGEVNTGAYVFNVTAK